MILFLLFLLLYLFLFLLGFPIGILISGNERINSFVRPILDTMQTMPVFVYSLIPAVLFFGLGKAPAVIATTIYAIVPVIRLTSHGIRQVDKEVVEAARAFGSTEKISSPMESTDTSGSSHYHDWCQPDIDDGYGYGCYMFNDWCQRSGYEGL